MKKLKTVLIYIFCFLFFAFCAFFSAGMLIPGASVAAEGTSRAPRLIEEGKINDDFGDMFENWFSKKFAYRSRVVSAFSALKADVFGAGNDQVIVGDGGFLFFGETVPSYTGIGTLSDEDIGRAALALKNMSEYAQAHGADFLFVPAPNKSTVYADMMPDRYVRCGGETELDRLFSKLDEYDVPYLDLRDTLISASEDGTVYHKRDTHWNSRGAYAAFAEIRKAFSLDVPEFSETGEREDFEGDLDSLLYPGEKRFDTDTGYDFTGRYVFTSAYSNEMNMSITTRGAGEGKLLIFRDSFANALIPFMASSYEEVRFERANPYRIDLLGQYGADDVIVLIAERNIKDLIGSDSRITGDD